MKKQNKAPRAIVIPAAGEPIWERKLVFARIRRRLRPPSPWQLWQNLGRLAWKGALALPALFRRPELVREVGPGLPPEPEHQWKRVRKS